MAGLFWAIVNVPAPVECDPLQYLYQYLTAKCAKTQQMHAKEPNMCIITYFPTMNYHKLCLIAPFLEMS